MYYIGLDVPQAEDQLSLVKAPQWQHSIPMFFHEVQKPLHRSSGFDSHPSGSRKAGIELSHVVAFVLQSPLHHFARVGVQHRQCLLASM
jgi:hypothetical protein